MEQSVIKRTYEQGKHRFLLLSDIHWDNPKCNRKLLKKHLDEALEGGHDIFLNGDTLDLMGGKKDRRADKETVRPEHNVNNYFDAVIEDAAEFFKPYAHLIQLIGYGNHETAIIKHNEIDPLKSLAKMIGREDSLGTYGGWVILTFLASLKHREQVSLRLKYHHGSGGGGPVTKGVIQFNRMATMIEGADVIWSGHVHESTELVYTLEKLNQFFIPELRNVLMVRTPTYKEEYLPGMGWHTERGGAPKPLGGRWLEVNVRRGKVWYKDFYTTQTSSL